MGISMVADSSLRCYVRAIIQVLDGLEEVFEERRPGEGKKHQIPDYKESILDCTLTIF